MPDDSINLRIVVIHSGIIRNITLSLQCLISDAFERIRGLTPDSFNNAEDEYWLYSPSQGTWLNAAQPLDLYHFHEGEVIEVRSIYRLVTVKTLDGNRKTLRISDIKIVGDLLPEICIKMGILNGAEYGLLHDDDCVTKDRNDRLTMLRRNSTFASPRNSEKIEKMQKKIHTDDAFHWLADARTLTEQGVEEKDTVLLRRRYFYSDKNIDHRDPVQLNLLYVELKDAIIRGVHPVSQKEAIQLAGIQCQVQMGNYTPDKSRSIVLSDVLPKEYIKIRGIDKKVFQEHGKMRDVSELESKLQYCQLCRSLKTYGITFFLVREKGEGKNKLCPRLLGINKDGVMRVDEKTKDILQTWPLTSIKQWAMRPNIFTLNFGNYAPGACYTAQTTQGEQIARLLAGYVDLIRKRLKKEHMVLDGDMENAIYEDQVIPVAATIRMHQTNIPGKIEMGDLTMPLSSLGQPKRASVNVNKNYDNEADEDVNTDVVHEDLIATKPMTSIKGEPVPAESFLQEFQDENDEPIIVKKKLKTQRSMVRKSIDEDGGYEKLDNILANDNAVASSDSQEISEQPVKKLKSLRSMTQKTIDEEGDYEKLENILDLDTQDISKRNNSQLTSQHSADRNKFDEYADYDEYRVIIDDAKYVLANGLQDMPKIGDDETSQQCWKEIGNVSKQRVADQLTAITSSTAAMVRASHLFQLSKLEHQNDRSEDVIMPIHHSLRIMAVHLPSLIEDVKRVAWSQTLNVDTSADDILEAARKLADAFTDLLSVASRSILLTPTNESPLDNEHFSGNHLENAPSSPSDFTSNSQVLLRAANLVGEASNELLRQILEPMEMEYVSSVLTQGEENMTSESGDVYQMGLLDLAAHVVQSVHHLVAASKDSAGQLQKDGWPHQDLVAAARNLGYTASQFITCAKLVAPGIHQSSCQEQLFGAVTDVNDHVNHVVIETQRLDKLGLQEAGTSLGVEEELRSPAEEVHAALEQLLLLLNKEANRFSSTQEGLSRGSGIISERPEGLDGIVAALWSAYEAVRNENDDHRLQGASRRLTQVTEFLIDAINVKKEAIESIKLDSPDAIHGHRQLNTLQGLKKMKDAAVQMQVVAKELSAEPQNEELHVTLRRTADYLLVTIYLHAEGVSQRVVLSLQLAARLVVTAATQLVNTSQAAAKKSRSSSFQLCEDGRHVADLLPKMVLAVRESKRDPLNPLVILELIAACQEFVAPCEQLCMSSDQFESSVTDVSMQRALSQNVLQLRDSLLELHLSLGRAEPLGRIVQLPGAVLWINRLLDTVECWKRSLHRNSTVLMTLPPRSSFIGGTNVDNLHATEENSLKLTQSVQQAFHCANQLYDTFERLKYLEMDKGDISVSVATVQRIDVAEEALGGWSRDLALALDSLTQSTRMVSSSLASYLFDQECMNLNHESSDDKLRDIQLSMLTECHDTLIHAHLLLREICHCRNVPICNIQLGAVMGTNNGPGEMVLLTEDSTPDAVHSQRQPVDVLFHELLKALKQCLQGLPYHRELDVTLEHIRHAFEQFQVKLAQRSSEEVSQNEMTAFHSLQEIAESCLSEFASSVSSLGQESNDFSQTASLVYFVVTAKKMLSSVHYLLSKGVSVHKALPQFFSTSHEEGKLPFQYLQRLVQLVEDIILQAKRIATTASEKVTTQEIDKLSTNEFYRHLENNRVNMKNIAKLIGETVTDLVSLCILTVNENEEACLFALQQVEKTRILLIQRDKTYSSDDYYTTLYEITQLTPTMAEGLKGMTVHASHNSSQLFCEAVKKTADSSCSILEKAAHNAHLLLTEQGAVFHQCQQFIGRQVDDISSVLSQLQHSDTPINVMPESHIRKVVQLCTGIAFSTKRLTDACRSASHDLSDPSSKRQLIHLAKQVVIFTSHLMSQASLMDNRLNKGSPILVQEVEQSFREHSSNIMNAITAVIECVMADETSEKLWQTTPECKQGHDAVISVNECVVDDVYNLFTAARRMVSSFTTASQKETSYSVYSASVASLSAHMKKLIVTIKEHAPGQRECLKAMHSKEMTSEQLEKTRTYLQCLLKVPVGSLEEAQTLKSIKEVLPFTVDLSYETTREEVYQKLLSDIVNEILQSIETLSQSAKSDAFQMSHLVMKFSENFDPLVRATVAAASKTASEHNQIVYVTHASTLLQACYIYLVAVKEAGGNPYALKSHKQVDEMSDGVRETCGDYLTAINGIFFTLESSPKRRRKVPGILTLERHSSYEHEQVDFDSIQERNYLECIYETGQRIIKMCEKVDKDGELSNVSVLGRQLKQEFQEMLQNAKFLAEKWVNSSDLKNHERAQRVLQSVQSVGKSSLALIRSASNSPSPFMNDRNENQMSSFTTDDSDCALASKELIHKVEILLAALHDDVLSNTNPPSLMSQPTLSNEVYTSTTNESVSSLEERLNKLSTKIEHCYSGQISGLPAPVQENWSDVKRQFQDEVIYLGKSLLEGTRSLLRSTDGSKMEVDISANHAILTAVSLSDAVYENICYSQDPSKQVLLLDAVKDVALSLKELVNSACHLHQHECLQQDASLMKDDAKNIVGKVSNLLRTFQLVDMNDETSRHQLLLQCIIEVIEQEKNQLVNSLVANDENESKMLVRFYRHPLSDAVEALHKELTNFHTIYFDTLDFPSSLNIVKAATFTKHVAVKISLITRAVLYHVEKADLRDRMCQVGPSILDNILQCTRLLQKFIHEDSETIRLEMVKILNYFQSDTSCLLEISEGIRDSTTSSSSSISSNTTEVYVETSPMHVSFTEEESSDRVSSSSSSTYRKSRNSLNDSVSSTSTCEPEDILNSSYVSTTTESNISIISSIQLKNNLLSPSVSLASPQEEGSDFFEAIRESAKAVVTASKGLIDAAISARSTQHSSVAPLPEEPIIAPLPSATQPDDIRRESASSEKLLNAAREVGSATQAMYESVTSIMALQNVESVESPVDSAEMEKTRLIEAARRVAESTRALVDTYGFMNTNVDAEDPVVCARKKSYNQLQSAGSAVHATTDQLLRTVQDKNHAKLGRICEVRFFTEDMENDS